MFDTKDKTMLIFNVIAGLILLIGILMLVAKLARKTDMVGESAPSFLYSPINGDGEAWMHPKEYQWITFFVFATQCPHCTDAVPLWNTLIDEDNQYGMIVGLSMSSSGETIEFMADNNTKFPVILVGGEFMEGYSISGTPSTITIHNGIIDNIAVGKPDEQDMSYLIAIHRKGEL